MSREQTSIQHALKQCHSLIYALEARVAGGTEPSLGTEYDRLSAQVGALPDVHAIEMSAVMSASTATRKLAASSAEVAAVRKVVSGLSPEDSRRLRRIGIDTKYCGIKTEGDLFDMRHAESKAKGGS